MTLSFHILGHLEVLRDAVPVDVGGLRQRAVLAALLLRANRMVSADRLIDDIWAGYPPAGGKTTLHAYVSKLRRSLEPDRPPGGRGTVLVSESSGYVLRVDPDQVDALRFESLAEAGLAALTGDEPERAATLLSTALSLWRGPALADFASEAFAVAHAARLEELRLTVIEDRIEASLALGRHRSVLGELEALIRAHPLRERLRGQLMVAQYRAGHRTEALRAYNEAQSVLDERLGIEPSPTLRALERAIAGEDPTLDWRPPRRPAPIRAATGGEAVSPFIGREEELALLHRRLSEALSGHGRLVLVTGDTGIGKTRLVEELAATAGSAEVEVVWGRGYEGERTTAFSLWIEVVRMLAARIGPSDLRAALGAGAVEIGRIVPEVRELLPDVEAPTTGLPETVRFRFYDTMARFFNRLAGRRPLVILLDDVHLADMASLELLGSLSPRLATAPILLVATYSDIDVDSTHPLLTTLAKVGYEPVVSRLTLRGLGIREVTRFVAETSGVEPSAALAAALHERTEGNPLFLGELVRLLQAEDRLSPSDVLGATVPDEVRAVIARRLAGLPRETLRLLEVAAVTGRNFDLEVLAAAEDLPSDRILERLEAAFAKGLLAEDPTMPGRYRFGHGLVRDALSTGLSRRRRTDLHRRVADAQEHIHRSDEPPPPP